MGNRSFGRTLVLLFMFVNFLLSLYIGYQLFRTADFLQNSVNWLSIIPGVKPPDFNELRGLAIYVILYGFSLLAIAFWIEEDSSKIQMLMRTRKIVGKSKRQEYQEELKPGEIELLECPECGQELSPGFELCPKCGFELKLTTCPKCGKEVSRTFNLCPYCGTKLTNKTGD